MIPPKQHAGFVWRMETVLDLYEADYDARFPVVCFDERPCQLLGHLRPPLGMRPGSVERVDYE